MEKVKEVCTYSGFERRGLAFVEHLCVGDEH